MLRQFTSLLGVAVVCACAPAAFAANNEVEMGGRDPASVADRAPAARDSSDNDDDEYNFSWLDPDKKVYVLQNRKYRKGRHLAVYLSGGLNLSNPYRTEYMGIVRAGYWFTEQLGIDMLIAGITNAENGNFKALKAVSASALPYVREHKSYYGALFVWAPWYAKINFFNKILYFDWFMNAGLGQVSTQFDTNNRADSPPNPKSEGVFSAFYGTGQNFYVTRNFLVRWDLIGMLYNATGADNKSKKNYTNFDFALGIGYIF